MDNLVEEIWKDIPTYEGIYQASNLGKIKSLERIAIKKYRGNRVVKERIMLGTINEDGYLKVHFKNNNRNNSYFIHRLIAQTFIDNPYNKEQINHKDGNKLNNKVDNLEWVTNLENQQHAWRNRLKYYKGQNDIKVLQFNMDNKFIKEYKSITDAHKQCGISLGNICNCCKGKRSSAGGYKWRYKNEWWFIFSIKW